MYWSLSFCSLSLSLIKFSSCSFPLCIFKNLFIFLLLFPFSTDSEKGKDYLSITMSPYQSPTPSVTDDVVLSKVARTHTFKRLRTPSRCRGCDTYVYFHGFECDIVSDAHVHTFLIIYWGYFYHKKLRQKYISIHVHVHCIIIIIFILNSLFFSVDCLVIESVYRHWLFAVILRYSIHVHVKSYYVHVQIQGLF